MDRNRNPHPFPSLAVLADSRLVYTSNYGGWGGCYLNTEREVSGFLLDCRSRNLSEHTITAYQWALDKLQATHPELPLDPDPLTYVLATQDLASESRHDLWRVWTTFYRWIAYRYDVPNPMDELRPPRRDRLIPRTLEKSEVEHLLSTIEHRRDLAMVSLILDTGLRLNEVTNLRWPHVQDGRILVVDGKGGKQRYVPIRPEVRQLIEGLGDGYNIWTGRGRGPYNGHALLRSGVTTAIKRVLRNAGIRPPKAGPHLLRHTFGRHFIKSGGDLSVLQRILGHEDLSTTIIYAYMDDDDVQEQHAKHSPFSSLIGQASSSKLLDN